MADRFAQIVEVILRHEGGYVNHPNDPGGETKWGISKRSYPHLDIASLTREQAVEIYRRDWWERYRICEIQDDRVASKVLDMAVWLGPATAVRYLQVALNACGADLAVDGVIGPQTLRAANAADGEQVVIILRALAAAHVMRLVEAQPVLSTFVKGWLRRAFD